MQDLVNPTSMWRGHIRVLDTRLAPRTGQASNLHVIPVVRQSLANLAPDTQANSAPSLPGPGKAANIAAWQSLGNPVPQANSVPSLLGPGKAARQRLGNPAPVTQATSAPGLSGPGKAARQILTAPCTFGLPGHIAVKGSTFQQVKGLAGTQD